MGIRHRIHRFFGGNIEEVQIVFRAIGADPGTMFDVGAHQGSSLAPFLAHGWTVHAFEPDPSNRAILSTNYPDLQIDSRAVSDVDGEDVSLFTSDVSTGISTLSPFHPTHRPTATVKTVRLDTYIRENGVGQVDFLKTDIEGHDLIALRAFPWESHRPKAVVCEFEDNKTVRIGHDVHDMAEFLVERGYSVVVSEWEPITVYGIQHTWRRFAHYPTEVPADSWGNLIAVEPALLSKLEKVTRAAARTLPMRRRVDRLLGLS